jgi:hypothetical protein
MKNRTDLEIDIVNFSLFSDQVRLVARGISEGKLDNDGILNSLEGIAVLIELHQDKTFDTFKQTFNLDEYNVLDTTVFNNYT